jgi:hypothetical protein
MQVEVRVKRAEEAADLVNRLSRRLEDQRPALLGLVDELLKIHRARFAGQGVRWRKLSPETLRIDRQQGRDPRININKGDLQRSLTVRGAPGQVVRVTPTSLRFGTTIFTARLAKRNRRNPVGTTRVQRKDVAARLKATLLEDL